jgi:hypothetical protein
MPLLSAATTRVPVEVVHVLNGHGLPVQVTNPPALGEVLGLLGILIALAAVIFAAESTRAAKKSAGLAVETLGLMQEEAEAVRAERARRADPVAIVHARNEDLITERTARDVILTLGFRNNGNRPAERVVVNFLIPVALRFSTCDQYGHATEDGRIYFTPETLDSSGNVLDEGAGCHYWAEDVGPIDPVAMNKVQFLRIYDPTPGIHVLKAALIQQDIPGGLRTWVWRLRIPEYGLVNDPDPIGEPVPPMRVFPPATSDH